MNFSLCTFCRGPTRGIIINWKSESINRMATAKLISMSDADDASVRCNCGCARTRSLVKVEQTRPDQS